LAEHTQSVAIFSSVKMLELEKVLEIADVMYFHENRLQESFDLLKTLDQSNVEVLYRMARVCQQLSKLASKWTIKAELIKNGFHYAQTAIAVDKNSCGAQTWYAVLLDLFSEIRGIKERAVRLNDVKMHIMRAKELDPKDPMSCHIYGNFNFALADMAWHERMILESLFAKA
jgi:hypothetical protein